MTEWDIKPDAMMKVELPQLKLVGEANVTQIQSVPTMLPIVESNVLRFDRPFAFRVTDKESDWVLFYGVVNNPNLLD